MERNRKEMSVTEGVVYLLALYMSELKVLMKSQNINVLNYLGVSLIMNVFCFLFNVSNHLWNSLFLLESRAVTVNHHFEISF